MQDFVCIPGFLISSLKRKKQSDPAGKEIILMMLTALYREDKDTEEAGVEGKVAGMRLRKVSALSEHRVALCLH